MLSLPGQGDIPVVNGVRGSLVEKIR